MLAGIPYDCDDSLIISLFHQFQLTTEVYHPYPIHAINQFKQELSSFLEANSDYANGLTSHLQAISTLFGIQIHVYCSRDYYLIKPELGNEIVTSAHLYYNGVSFDSIISSALSSASLYNDPIFITNGQKLMLKVATWNVNGALVVEKQQMIEYELK